MNVKKSLMIALLVCGMTAEASACINGTIRYEIHDVEDLQAAEKLVAQGKFKEAHKYLKRNSQRRSVSRRPRHRMRRGMKKTLFERRQRIYATIAIRTNGRYDLEGDRKPRARKRTLRAAAAVLGKGNDTAMLDPTRAGLVGEALSRLRKGRAEARTILEGLARKDLMTSPYGWLALARIRDTDAGRDKALESCRQMAADPAICRLSRRTQKKKRPRRSRTKKKPTS